MEASRKIHEGDTSDMGLRDVPPLVEFKEISKTRDYNNWSFHVRQRMEEVIIETQLHGNAASVLRSNVEVRMILIRQKLMKGKSVPVKNFVVGIV